MANTIRLKSSSVAGKIPTTTDLSLRELAVNVYDGKLFLKKSTSGNETGSGVSIVEIGAGTGGGSGANQADYGLLTEAVNSTADYGSLV